MRQSHEIGLGRQLVGRVAPIGVGEDPELAALNEGLEAILHPGKVLCARQRPVRDRLSQRGGLGRVGAERADDVDPVQRVQMIEVDHVVLNVLRRHDQIAQEPRIGRRRRADRLLDGSDRGDGVNGGAYAADALGESPSVARIAAAQDDLDAAKHRGRGPRVFDGAAVDFRFDAKMTLDPRDRVDDDVRHFSGFPWSSIEESGPWRCRTAWTTPWATTARCGDAGETEAHGVDPAADIESGHIGKTSVERRHRVPEVRLGAADARDDRNRSASWSLRST